MVKVVEPTKTNEYTVIYHVFNFNCPYCGIENEVHIHENTLDTPMTETCHNFDEIIELFFE